MVLRKTFRKPSGRFGLPRIEFESFLKTFRGANRVWGHILYVVYAQ